jgi:formylglycine-generating enzyme required for sulfatase activity
MWRCVIAGLLFCTSCLLCPGPAAAQKRAALVIGNGAYTKVPKLPNPPNDAAAMADMLRKAGFDRVESKTDLGNADLRRALRDFSEQLREVDVAIVFYAGHGMEMNGINYLIPIDATIARDVDVQDEAVSLDRVLSTIEPARHLQLVILDSCRDNPFVRSMRRTIATRSVRSGHGDIDERALPPNTLIAYAQKAGFTAEDGTGANSPYTTALLKHLSTPGLDVELALRRVRDAVLQATGNRQEPFKYGSLGGLELPLVPAALVPAPTRPEAVPTLPLAREAAEYWVKVEKSDDQETLEAYIRRYGETFHGDLAKARLAKLKRTAEEAAAEAKRKEEQRLAMLAEEERKRKEAEEAASKAAAGPKPGQTFRDCPECPEMVVVPAGSFTMGSPEGEEGRAEDEGPQRTVTIAKPFAVGKLEVTFAEWDACVSAGGCKTKPDDAKWGRGKRPVINLSWDDSKQYVSWLSQKTGIRYRLLTEAEWEYTARAGTRTPFSTGMTITTDQANFDGNYTYGGSAKGKYRRKTIEAGSFEPNAFGLHDMHGNVMEWVEDCYKDSYKGAPSDGSASTSGDCSRRVVRGGSWGGVPVLLRAALRGRLTTGDRYNALGFRVGRTLTP